jgi:ornithine cyclodeaminase
MVKEGAHINAVGACTPTTRELGTSLVKVGKFYGDSVESVLNEAGDFIIPLHEGAINQKHLRGSIQIKHFQFTHCDEDTT